MSYGPIFLSAHWEFLAIFNYRVPPKLLEPYLPNGTGLDLWEGDAVVSVVGFLFNQTKVFGIQWPWHTNFEELNLRFYVERREGGERRRGVVFISEIVPKPLIAWTANRFYNEKYSYMPMRHSIAQQDDSLSFKLDWRNKKKWNSLSVMADYSEFPILPGSEEEFIYEHYWGYSQLDAKRLIEYKVEHPRWKVYPVTSYDMQCNFEEMYGDIFAPYLNQTPSSVFLAKGSEVVVRNPRLIGL